MTVFDAFAAYERERAHSRLVERQLSKAISLLAMECGRRELRGEDVAHIREFIRANEQIAIEKAEAA